MPCREATRGSAWTNAEKSVACTWTVLPPAGVGDQLDAGGARLGDHGRGQRAVVAGADRVLVRPLGHQPADLAEVAGRGVPAGDHHLDAAGDLLDLLEDVGAEQDRPALVAELVEQLHQVQPLARVHPVERLVEQQHRGVVHDRGRHLDPLLHPLRVRADVAVLRVGHLDGGDRPPRGRLRVGELVQPGVGQDEVPAADRVVHLLALGHQPDLAVDLRVAVQRPPVEGHGARRRGEEPGHHVDQRGLAGAVGPEQAGDPGAEVHGDVVDRHHVAEPARDLRQLDGAHDSAFR